MIRVFYANDPLAADQGGGAEHFRGIFRALEHSGLEWQMVAARLGDRRHPRIDYIADGSHFGRWYLALWRWFWRHRGTIGREDVLHFHRNYAAWPKYLLCPGRGRVVITYHNVSGRVLDGMLGRWGQPIRLVMKALERRAVGLADQLICVSERDRQELAGSVASRPFQRAAVLAAAVDARGMVATAPSPPAGTTRLLLLGRLEHQKNPMRAVEVLERLAETDDRGWTLTIAGDGGLRTRLQQRIADSHAAARIVCTGLVPHDRVADLIDAHDMLLLTSRYEASPTVVKEALLRHRPVVSTDVGDVARWIEPGNGMICADDPGEIAHAVLAMADLMADGGFRPPSRLGSDAERQLMAPLIDLYRTVQAGG
ncbi:MAG TPA: glycosyltransferase family 4 protein [Geminicoccus sp.]|jgi:glycosyltransferase involved in cell wall biosynthesis|uniref:glycosyltransferase family 4 protein n=1 Tax=Geminicoccus sp. TaxID=2024832 RepID=UPI002E37B55E|nr:glycosyltransferase family 4 protein [Geminicoccus sp.]HEX2529577.1 glycosyltransferase family 4 protein [Geminicoccus sp.]